MYVACLGVIADAAVVVQVLSLNWCKAVTSPALVRVAEGCRYLRRLDLWKCVQLTSDAIEEVAAQCGASECGINPPYLVSSLFTHIVAPPLWLHVHACTRAIDTHQPSRLHENFRRGADGPCGLLRLSFERRCGRLSGCVRHGCAQALGRLPVTDRAEHCVVPSTGVAASRVSYHCVFGFFVVILWEGALVS